MKSTCAASGTAACNKEPHICLQTMVTSNGRRLVSPNYWKTLVPEGLLYLPRLQQAMKDIMQEADVTVDWASFSLASKILEHANGIIRGLPSHCLFKIGQTFRPVHRWSNEEYGYKHTFDQCTLLPLWSKMRLVGILANGESAGFMEAALISAWSSHPKCLNRAAGGEGVSRQDGPFFVYVVVSHLS